MAQQLTLDQLMVMERLHGQQYYLNGRVRTRERTTRENHRLGIPLEHEQWWHHNRLYGPNANYRSAQDNRLRSLLEQIRTQQRWEQDSDHDSSDRLQETVDSIQQKGKQ
jgi:hypothetical protein